jgi:hypothetical protein
MWSFDAPDLELDVLRNLHPEKTLLEYEGPRMFTARDSVGQLRLLYQCDEDAATWRFIVVPFNETLLARLEEGSLRIVEALKRKPMWLADLNTATAQWLKLRDATDCVLPPDYFPSPEVSLTRLSMATPEEGITLWKELGAPPSIPNP